MNRSSDDDSDKRFDLRWYEKLLEISPVGIFFTDAEGHCLHVNQRWCEIAGMHHDQALGGGWVQAIAKADHDRVAHEWYEAARTNQPFHSEYRFCTPDGQVTWVVGDARAIHKEDGSIEGYIGTITDIHRAKLDRIALKQHTERIRTIIEQMPVLLFAFDAQGCLSAWNAEAERVTGYSAQEMIGNPQAMEWLCPDPGYRRQMHDNYKRLGDDYLNWEWHLTAKDGTTRIVAFSNIAGRHPIDGWANWGVGVDVTSFRKTEQALGERVKELGCLYRLSMLSSQHNLNLEDFLGEAVELLPPSWQYPEITCARIVYQDKIFATDDFTSTPWKLSSQLHVRGRQVGLIEVYYREEKPELAEGPFLMEERLLIDEIALQISRTINHVLARQDLALLDELSARAGELEKFSHSVSHDLRTPLTAIGGYAQILEKQIQKNNLTEAKNSAEKIQKITVRMEQRLSELLKLAKIGKIIEPSEKIDLGALISDVLEMFENRLQAADISMRVDSDFPWVIGDRIRLMEVFENLLENAIKYIGVPPNTISIGYTLKGIERVFYVEDNGIGIAPEHGEDIFQIFWRLDKSSPGDGTGLAITKRIIEAHGGRIWVESEGPGHGARFCFTLGHVLEA